MISFIIRKEEIIIAFISFLDLLITKNTIDISMSGSSEFIIRLQGHMSKLFRDYIHRMCNNVWVNLSVKRKEFILTSSFDQIYCRMNN